MSAPHADGAQPVSAQRERTHSEEDPSAHHPHLAASPEPDESPEPDSSPEPDVSPAPAPDISPTPHPDDSAAQSSRTVTDDQVRERIAEARAPLLTGEMPVVGGPVAEHFAKVRQSVGSLEKLLLQGPREYSRRDLAERFGIPERLTALYWRSLGFTGIGADTVVFTEEDSYAIGDLAALVEEGVLSETSFANISRGLGFHMGRLAMWLTEAFVEDAKHEDGLSDPEARLAMIERLPQLLETLEDQVMYVFRRELAAYAARAGSEILHTGEGGADELFPLLRAVGFVDLVQFTRLTRQVSGEELAEIISRFEMLGRDYISVGGGRVVKTVGDEIMFLADTPEDGAQIAVSLAEAIADDDTLPPARIGLAWGSMFSRYGDVFGPTVNLAARLERSAAPGEVILDRSTADAVARAVPGDFVLVERSEVELAGIGPVGRVALRRGAAPPLSLSL